MGPLPYTRLTPTGEAFGGEVDMVKIMAQKLGFEMTIVKERTYGGVIDVVSNGTSKLGTGLSFFTYHRFKKADATYSSYQAETTFATMAPRPLSQVDNATNPFSLTVWLTTCATCVCVVLTLEVLTRHKGSKYLPANFTTSLEMFRILYGQSSRLGDYHQRIKQPGSLNFFLFTWIVVACIMVMAYECNLRSFLIKAEFEEPIETEGDLIAAGRFLYFSKGSAVIRHFVNSPFEDQRFLGEAAMKNEYFYLCPKQCPPLDQHDAIIGSEHATILNKMMLISFYDYFIERPYRIHLPKEAFAKWFLTVYVPKGSMHKTYVQDILQRLFEAGLPDKLMFNYLSPRLQLAFNEPLATLELKPLTMMHVMGTVIPLITILSLASLAFGYEIVGHRSRKISSIFL